MQRAWAKVSLFKRRSRINYGSRARMDGREEFVIKIEGFAGELRRTMSVKEAERWVNDTNKASFMEASKASKSGPYGVERFNQYGSGASGFNHTMARIAARGFADTKEDKKNDGGEK